MAIDWKVAFPLHPEFRTLPMVWYVPPLSPIRAAAENDQIGMDGDIPDVRSCVFLCVTSPICSPPARKSDSAGVGADAGDAQLYARQNSR